MSKEDLRQHNYTHSLPWSRGAEWSNILPHGYRISPAPFKTCERIFCVKLRKSTWRPLILPQASFSSPVLKPNSGNSEVPRTNTFRSQETYPYYRNKLYPPDDSIYGRRLGRSGVVRPGKLLKYYLVETISDRLNLPGLPDHYATPPTTSYTDVGWESQIRQFRKAIVILILSCT